MEETQKYILKHLPQYLELKKWNHTKRGNKMYSLDCPLCGSKLSANFVVTFSNIFATCLACRNDKGEAKRFTLLDLAKKVEQTEDEAFLYRKITEDLILNLSSFGNNDEVKTYLDFYTKNGFDLVPEVHGDKIPAEGIGKEWSTKIHKDRKEWEDWIYNKGLNIGIKTGKPSGITVIDIDAMPGDLKRKIYKKLATPEEIKEAEKIRDERLPKILKLLGNPETKTLHQKTYGGIHLVFLYNEKLPTTRIDELYIDILNDGKKFTAAPSTVFETKREMELREIIEMPNEVFKVLKDKVTVPDLLSHSEKIREEIDKETYKKPLLKEGDGRNDLFVHIGGMLRKKLNKDDTGYVLSLMNKTLTEKGHELPYKEINTIVNSLDRYSRFDESEMAHEILEYLKTSKSASVSDIEMVVLGERAKSENKKRIDKTIQYLIKEDYVYKKGRVITLIEKLEWQDNIVDVGVPIDFEIPYFGKYANFNWGDLIIIGGKVKTGKTTLAINVLQRLIKQGIKPYYIYNESGSRYSKTACQLGLKDGDFYRSFCSDPNKAILEPGAVTIYDWVRPIDFADTANIFDSFTGKLEKTKGILICFVQLKQSKDQNKNFFAENMIGQFPALMSKYVLKNEEEGSETHFEVSDVREPKNKGRKFQIDCLYNWEDKTVKTLEEVAEENK